MLLKKAPFALLHGFKLCLLNSAVRKLALWPWLISALVYLLVATAAWFSHEPLVNWIVPNPDGIIKWGLYYLAWAGTALFLVISTLITSLILAIVLTGVFQESIAHEVLKQNGVNLPEEPQNLRGFAFEMARSIKTESAKLLWLIPLGVMVLIMGFAPFLAPFAFIVAAWILGFESSDVVWEVLKKPARQRFSFARANWISVTLYGLSLSVIGFVPFMGILIPPIAVAGASWMLSESVKENAS